MPVINGQAVSAEVTNPAFIDAEVDDSAAGKIDFLNTDSISGPFVYNIQQNVNYLIENDKLFIHTADHSKITFTAPNLIFTANIVIELKDVGFTNVVSSSNSPLSIADGYSVYLTLNRTSNATITPTVALSLPQGLNVFRLCTRIGNALIFWDNTLLRDGKSARIGESVEGGQVYATYFDPVSTVLPSGPAPTFDGFTIANGDTVLFTNLSSGNNQIYQASNVGVSVVWTAIAAFPNGFSASVGDAVRIEAGVAFSAQLAVFNGTNFTVNDIVRYFTGADYYEVSGLKQFSISNNTTGTIFSLTALNSENLIVDFSVTRGTAKEIGTVQIITDGINANTNQIGGYLNSTAGITLFADISGGNLRLRYTTDNSGSAGLIKYSVKRWADVTGGPAGPISYTPSGSIPANAAGLNTQIQFNSFGFLGADSDFTWDSTNNILTLSGRQHVAQQSATLINNQSSPLEAFNYSASYNFAIIEYSIQRNTDYTTGRMMIAHNGSIVSISDDQLFIPTLGITFSAQLSMGTVSVQYTSTNTGFNATMKYEMRRWS